MRQGGSSSVTIKDSRVRVSWCGAAYACGGTLVRDLDDDGLGGVGVERGVGVDGVE